MADISHHRADRKPEPQGPEGHGWSSFASPQMRAFDDTAIPTSPMLALFCSVRCPGKVILDTYDAMQRVRDAGVTVISGFHSPMEKECRTILIRAPTPVVWCLARGMLKVIPADLKGAVDNGQLVLVTPFPEKVRYITAKTAMVRNRVVADMASAVFIPHAAAGSKMEALCQVILRSGKPLYTFDHPANSGLLRAGANTVSACTDWKQILKEG